MAPLSADQLNPTDRAILDELRGGRCTPGFIAEKHGYTSGNVRNRLGRLVEHQHVTSLGAALYELADDPRGGDGEGVDLDTLRRHLEAIQTAAERGDRGELSERLEKALAEINKREPDDG